MAAFIIGDYSYTTSYSTKNVSAKVIDSTKTSYSNIPKTVTYNNITYTVTSLSYCFEGCTSLTTAPTIPNSVTSMYACFHDCTSLTTAPIIPDSVTDMYGCFYGCTNLTTASTIGSSVTSMDYCFCGCTSLTTAPTIPNSVTSMSACFYDCTSLTTAPTIPNNVTSIVSCFQDCTNLTTASTIGSSVTNMSYCFCGCTSLTTAPTIPNSVTNMSACFYGCASITTAPTIPNGVTNMFSCFYGCTSLTTAPTIPNSVISMHSCFRGCTSLTIAPTIGSSVTNMFHCFHDCTSLTTAPTIPNSVTDMSSCFYGCTSLTTAPTISISSSVTYMDSCFHDCTSLTTAPTIPDNVVSMLSCFYGCTSLTTAPTISISSSVTYMDSCFYGCTSLTTAPTIPSNVNTIDSCFKNCTSLTTAPAIPSNVNYMSSCFEGCTGLTTAPAIPSYVQSMYRCFYGCTALTGNIIINATILNNYTDCFRGTEKGIILEGTAPNLQTLAATANNNNVYVGSIPLSYSLTAERVSSDGATSPDPTGVYAHIQQTINWSDFTYNNIDSIVLKDNLVTKSATWYTDAQKTSSITLPDWHPASNVTIHSWISIDDYTHNLVVSVSDEYSTGSGISFVIPQAFRTIDFQAGGKEIAFGTVADDNVSSHLNGLFKCNMDAVFKQEFNVEGDITAGGDIEDGSGNVLADKIAEDSNGDISITRNITAGGQVTADKYYSDKKDGVAFEHIYDGSNGNQNTGMSLTRSDTNVSVGFMIGSGGNNHGVYSGKHNRWTIYDDTSGDVKIPANLKLTGLIYADENSAAIGSQTNAVSDSNTISLTAGTWKTLYVDGSTSKTAISIPKGCYTGFVDVQFSAATGSYRSVYFGTSSTGTSIGTQVGGSSSSAIIAVRHPFTLNISSATTYYVRARSGVACNVTSWSVRLLRVR